MPATAKSVAPTTQPQHKAGIMEPYGLTSEQAQTQLAKYGPNTIPDTETGPWRRALVKFWAPVPWMLEAAITLQIILHEYVEAAVIAGLLLFNAALGKKVWLLGFSGLGFYGDFHRVNPAAQNGCACQNTCPCLRRSK